MSKDVEQQQGWKEKAAVKRAERVLTWKQAGPAPLSLVSDMSRVGLARTEPEGDRA